MTAAVPLLCAANAFAMDFDTGNDSLKIRWDNALKYSNAFRLKSPSPALLGDVNQDDADRNFSKRGLVSNRFDWLSDLDVVYDNDYGFRVSGAAWYDSIYHRDTHNDSPGTYNAVSVPSTEFTAATRAQHGSKAELLDAFVFGKGDIDGVRWGLRGGKHTLLWGETLFFGANGIAGGQAPIDVAKLLAVPNSQFKEILRPVGQISGTLQITPDVLFGAYYQYRWERTRLPGVGSYFSTEDLFDVGGERFFLGGPAQLRRGDDVKPPNSGQGGVQLRFRLPGGQTDYGIYAIRYHEKTPNLYLNIPLGTYSIAFQKGVQAYGFSASRTFGDVNLAGEASLRQHAALSNSGSVNFTRTPATSDNPLYPVGKTAHANVSAVWTLPITPLFQEATFLGEVGWNRRLSVSNGGILAVNSTRSAWGTRMVLTPTYRQALTGLDLSVPLGLGYNPKGASQSVVGFNGGVNKGGDVSLGLNGNYLNTWNLGLNYTHYFGAAGTTLEAGQVSFKQDRKDRDFVSMSVQTTF